jgi:polysaccharide export outer membrane protein
MRKMFFLMAACAAVAASAQTASTPLQLPSPLPSVSSALSTPAAQPPAAAAASARTAPPGLLNGYVPDDTYKLRVGDTVSFQIVEDQIWDPQNAPKILVVQDSGEIEVPYVGRVMAVGTTCNKLADEIKGALEKDYYKHATVVISMNVASPILGRVYIWGQVQHQGPLDIQVNENLTAGQAILRAGGFADFANQRKVKVIRSSTGPDKSKQTETINLDMEQILSEGKTDKDIILQPGDLIIVPAKLLNF